MYAFLCISVVSRGFLSITGGSSLLHPSLYYLSISLRRINRDKRPCVGDVSSAARVASPGPLNARRERFRGKYEKSGKVQRYLCALRSYRVWTDRLEKVYCSWKSWNESAALRPLPFVCTNGPSFPRSTPLCELSCPSGFSRCFFKVESAQRSLPLFHRHRCQ